jgi:TfoX/Sxy family transcriptional regulator of competence genes
MSYFAAPADVLENSEELLVWSRRSVTAAGTRKAAANPKRRRHRKA